MFKYISLLLLSIVCLTACTEENTLVKPQSEKPVNEEEEIVKPKDETGIEVVEPKDETEVEVVETPQILSEPEIQAIMGKFEKMGQLVIDTHFTLTFSNEEFYSAEMKTAKLMENLPESIHELISNDMFNNQLPKLIQSMYEASGEGGLIPLVNLDARMEIIENTPKKVHVKTFQLVEQVAYSINMNVYLTAIEENGQWVIDEYKPTYVENEPINLTKDEFIRHEQLVHDSEIEFIAEETITSPSDISQSKTGNALIIRIVKDGRLLARFTDSGEIAFDIPDKYK